MPPPTCQEHAGFKETLKSHDNLIAETRRDVKDLETEMRSNIKEIKDVLLKRPSWTVSIVLIILTNLCVGLFFCNIKQVKTTIIQKDESMSLLDQIQNDLIAIVANGELSQSVTYTTKAGGVKQINVVLGEIETSNYGDEIGESTIKQRDVTLSTDSTYGIETPARLDSVTISGGVWKVVDIPESGYGKAVLSVVLDEPAIRRHDMNRKQIAG